MASYLFSNNSSSSSDHNDFNYVTPIGRKRVCRKIFNDDDVIDVDDYMRKENNVNDGSKTINISDDENVEDGYDGNDDFVNNVDDFEEDDVENEVEDECEDDVEDEVEDDVEDGDDFENNNKVVPCVGMEFNSLDEAEKFYRDYGRSVGFEIIIRSTHKYSKNSEISSRLYICRKGGRLGSKNSDFEDNGKEKRPRDVIP